jgi:hypothetical protein
MQGIEAGAENVEPRVTVDADGTTGVQRAADAASAVSRALSAAGYSPRHLSVTSSESGELVLVARLEQHARGASAIVVPSTAAPPERRSNVFGRVAVGVALGVVLGFLGLPRLELPALTAPTARPTPVQPQIISVQDLSSANTLTSTPESQLVPTVAPTVNPIVFDTPLTSPIAGWPNDTRSTAWFGGAGYQLVARDAGRFVAIGVPLGRPLQNFSISAMFHKSGGPAGGGYGLIIRDQGQTTDRDGRNQAGKYLVFEVGDRGDIGVWQRDDTRWIDITPWQHADAVHPDRALNTLLVTARGSTASFEVNGQKVADVSYDKLPTSGGVGIFAGGDLNEVTLERLRIANSD